MNLFMLEAAKESSANSGSILLIALALAVVIIAVILVFVKKGKKTKQISKVKVDDVLIQNIINLFTKENVISVESEVSRVKFEVKDLDLVNLDEVKKISNGVFVTGNNVKVMFKDSADEIVSKLKEYYK